MNYYLKVIARTYIFAVGEETSLCAIFVPIVHLLLIELLFWYKYSYLQSSSMIVTSTLIIWKALMCIIGSESPVVIVLSGSMELGFKRVSRQTSSSLERVLACPMIMIL